MSIHDEELVLYLLNEAEPTLVRRVEACLRTDPDVAARLQELRAALGLLDSIKGAVEPPIDLVARTMASIEDQSSPGEDRPTGDSPVDDADLVHLSRASLAAAQPIPGSSRGVWDSAVLTLSIVALTSLMLPLVLEARSQSRRMQCAEHLRALGRGLTQWAMLNREHRFPSVPVNGCESFAGVYAVKLQDIGELESAGYLQCVSIPATPSSPAHLIYVPTTNELRQGTAAQMAWWREKVGGNYAYNFGVIDEGRIVGQRLEGRTHLAILSDAPQVQGDCDLFFAHNGQGINLYYEDGHVAFLRLPRCNRSDRPLKPDDGMSIAASAVVPMKNGWRDALDYPFRNLEGRQAHGLTLNDAALGASKTKPLPSRISLP